MHRFRLGDTGIYVIPYFKIFFMILTPFKHDNPSNDKIFHRKCSSFKLILDLWSFRVFCSKYDNKSAYQFDLGFSNICYWTWVITPPYHSYGYGYDQHYLLMVTVPTLVLEVSHFPLWLWPDKKSFLNIPNRGGSRQGTCFWEARGVWRSGGPVFWLLRGGV